MAELQAADIAVLYLGGRQAEVALIARAAKERGYSVPLVAGDGVSSEDFGVIAGSAADGTLFTFAPDRAETPKQRRSSSGSKSKSSSRRVTPCTRMALSKPQAVEMAGSLELPAVISSLRSQQFNTVLGPIGFDNKGDVRGSSWIWYVWTGGGYAPVK